MLSYAREILFLVTDVLPIITNTIHPAANLAIFLKRVLIHSGLYTTIGTLFLLEEMLRGIQGPIGTAVTAAK